MNIYVGNLSNHTSEDELRQAFASFGEVSKVNIISDRYTGESRGFAFVEMPNQAEGQAAIDGLNGTDLGGRTLSVNVARPRQAAVAAAAVVLGAPAAAAAAAAEVAGSLRTGNRQSGK
jgi:RNA recognition motif-containing protein